ncbi:MAG: riboflavin biosynthesis protein RibF [Candidatus Eisenbacteria bacterium]
MKVVRSLDAIGGPPPKAVVAIGVFDGVHAGHRIIFERVVRESAALSATPTVFTFDPHPRMVVRGARPPRILTPLDEKLRILDSLGIGLAVVIPFDREFASMSAGEFVRSWLVRPFDVRRVVVGYDFRLGRDREGNGAVLGSLGSSHGFTVDQVPPFLVDGRPVKSTWVRDEIEAGNVRRAAELLRRYHSLEGRVVRGDGRGSGLGFPTANLSLADEEKLRPRDGVYAAFAEVPGKVWPAVVNIGVRPTFGGGRAIEGHLLGFRGDLLGSPMTLHFVHRLRDERAFPSTAELASRIERDREQAGALLGEGDPTFAFTRF